LDGGIYSVNIALNSHQDDFKGGGTFLERLVDNKHGNDVIQRPCGPGHALIHSATERHAGAPTTEGIRDILVLFLTTRQDSKATGIERGHRLKALIERSPIPVRIDCLKLAIKENPLDGEAFMWIGLYELNGDGKDPASVQRWNEINSSVEHLKTAAYLSPCSGRVRYFLGMALDARVNILIQFRDDDDKFVVEKEMKDVVDELEKCLQIESECKKAGCNNDIDEAAVLLKLEQTNALLGKRKEA
jgi:hypothetical protein